MSPTRWGLVIALPAELRQRLHLDEPGAQLEITERPDGVLELRAALPVPADQAWFWAEQWQQREREVDEHVNAGRLTVHESTDDFLANVDELAAGSDPAGGMRDDRSDNGSHRAE